MDPDIRHINGHYEAYINGQFICSGDTKMEIENDLKEMKGK